MAVRYLWACSWLLLSLLAGCDYFISAEDRLRQAEQNVSAGDYRGASIELKNALQSRPDFEEARLLLAQVQLWLGDATAADAELNRVRPGAAPARYESVRAETDLALGRHQQLLERLTQESALAPSERLRYRGDAHRALGQLDRAEQAFREALQLDPRSVRAQAGLVEVLAARNHVGAALDLSRQLVADHPDGALAWYIHGTLLARRGNSVEALHALTRARQLGALDVVRQAALLTSVIELQLSMRDLESARAANADLNKLAPGSGIAKLMSARLAMATNDYAAAATQLRRLVNSAPTLVQARLLLGVALAAQGHLEQASQELGRLVADSPENIEARQLLAQVRLRLKDPDGAMRVLVPALQSGADSLPLTMLADAARVQSSGTSIEVLENGLRETPGNKALELQLARAYLQIGAPAKAVELLEAAAVSDDPQREAVLLHALLQSRGEAAARARVESFLNAKPDDAQRIGLTAGFYARVGDVERARRMLQDALSRKPAAHELLMSLAQLEWANGRPAAAKAALGQLLQASPRQSTARLALAEIELALGDSRAASEQLEKVRRDEPRAVEPRFMLARLALARDDAALAETLVEEAVNVAPRRTVALNTAGLIYLDSGRYDQAIGHLLAGTQADPADALLWLNLARAQLALGQLGAARDSLQRAIDLRPNWLAAEGVMTFLELQEGRREAALQRLAALQRVRPHDADVRALQGEVHLIAREFAAAAAAFDAAFELQPRAALAVKSHQSRVAGELPQPAEPLERWLARNPQDATVRSILAQHYTQAGQPQRAAAAYEELIARYPQNAAALNNLAWVYHEMGDPRALQVAKRASALAPQAPAVMDTLGWILLESGRPDEALPLLESAAQRPDVEPEIRYHYAVALARAGSKNRARALLQELLGGRTEFPSREAASRLAEELTRSGG